jgi:hypothetical protein
MLFYIVLYAIRKVNHPDDLHKSYENSVNLSFSH